MNKPIVLLKHNRESLKGAKLVYITVELGLSGGKPYHRINQRPVMVNALPNVGPCHGCDIVIDNNSTKAALIYENNQPDYTAAAANAFFLFPNKSGSLHGYCLPENLEAATAKLSSALTDALDDKIEALRLELKLAESLETYIANL